VFADGREKTISQTTQGIELEIERCALEPQLSGSALRSRIRQRIEEGELPEMGRRERVLVTDLAAYASREISQSRVRKSSTRLLTIVAVEACISIWVVT
jgi:hypothetical protein